MTTTAPRRSTAVGTALEVPACMAVRPSAKVPVHPASEHFMPMLCREFAVCPSLPKPGPSDWLACHKEPGQTFQQFRLRGQRIEPHATYNCITMVVLGDDPAQLAQLPIEAIRQYTQAFYQLDVTVVGPVPTVSLPNRGTQRDNDYGPQLLTGDCLEYLRALPSLGTATKHRTKTGGGQSHDAVPVGWSNDMRRRSVCCIGITVMDLYNRPDWNFVFGLASTLDGVGVFSLARFVGTATPPATMLQRACQVVTHEIGHMFGLKHCVHKKCLMNGVNTLDELDRAALLECPCCTLKLTDTFGWHAVDRQHDVAAAMVAVGMPAATAVAASERAQRYTTDGDNTPPPPPPWKPKYERPLWKASTAPSRC